MSPMFLRSTLYANRSTQTPKGRVATRHAPPRNQRNRYDSGCFHVLVDELGHLEHRDFVLAAEHGTELVIGVDHTPLLLILAAVALDVLPELLRDLRARHRIVADHRGERRVGLHRLHEGRIRRPLRTCALRAASRLAGTTTLLRTTAFCAGPLRTTSRFFRCHSHSR